MMMEMEGGCFEHVMFCQKSLILKLTTIRVVHGKTNKTSKQSFFK